MDNDELVHRAAGAALEELRGQAGGYALHEAESAALREALTAAPPLVAGAAAWVVVPAENRAAIRASGAYTIWLRARPDTLAGRIGNDPDRPWLRPDPRDALTRMATERDPLYAEISHLVLDVDDATPTQTAQEIERKCR